jgi:RimJ/RimL family protein N-acetyltransferase
MDEQAPRRIATEEVTLREVIASDLPIFFAQQLDPVANRMAAFTAKDPTDEERFAAHWAKILGDATTINRTVLVAAEVVGHVACFEQFGEHEVTYWLGREFWGKGIATAALAALLREVSIRPLHARAASDNLASIRVLEKCGFVIVGADRGFANARGAEIDEAILRLDGTP